MATSSTVSILCSPCLRDEVYRDGVRYCADCNENFCRPCLRQHIQSHAHSGHRLLGRTDVPAWMMAAVAGSGETMCTRHTDQLLTRYCQDHATLCCQECEDVEHSSCSSVLGIQEATEKLDTSGDQVSLTNDLHRLSGEVERERNKHKDMQAIVRKSTVKSLASVRDIRSRANVLFEELEQEALDGINTECIARDDELESYIAKLDVTSALLDACTSKIDAGEGCGLQFLLQIQRGKTVRSEAERLLSKIRKSNVSECQREFVINPRIVPFLDSLTSLGGFVMRQERGLSYGDCRDICIHHSSDLSDCSISGVTSLLQGTLVVVDFENEKIKCLSPSLELSEHSWLQMCSEPFAVCVSGETEVAVSLPGVKLVQYLSVRPEMVLERAIQTEECCRGVAYSHLYDELYVACGGGAQQGEGLGQIHVYKEGNLINTFKMDGEGRPITSRPMHLAVSNDGSHIHIADAYKGLITVNRSGQVVSTFTTRELEEARGVCVDVNNNIIVCGYKSNNVIQVNKDRQGSRVLLEENDGVKHPTAVFYNTRTASLIVANGSSDCLKVFKGKKR